MSNVIIFVTLKEISLLSLEFSEVCLLCQSTMSSSSKKRQRVLKHIQI